MGLVTWDEGKSSVGNLVTHGAEDAQCLTRSLLTPSLLSAILHSQMGTDTQQPHFSHPMGLGMLSAALYLSRASLQSHAIVAGELEHGHPQACGSWNPAGSCFLPFFLSSSPRFAPRACWQ